MSLATLVKVLIHLVEFWGGHMGFLILLLAIVAYTFIGVIMLRILYEILSLFGWHQFLLQPFILNTLEFLHIPANMTFIIASWVLLFILSIILFFQLPFMHDVFLQFQNVTKLEGRTGNYIQNAWNDVCHRANVSPYSYTLYLQHQDLPAAFACGHNRVVVSKGMLLTVNDRELRSILAHELSHLVHRDTVYSASHVSVHYANMVFTEIFIFYNSILYFIYNILRFIPIINIIALLFLIQIKIINWIILFLQSIVHYIFMFLIPFASRKDEYRADKYAHELGLGEELASALNKLSVFSYDEPGIFNQLLASHPPIHKRIARLQQLAKGQ